MNSWIPHVIDALCQSTFLALVMVYWLSVYHGVRKVKINLSNASNCSHVYISSGFLILKSDRNFLTFYVPKFLIVFFIWIMSIFLLLWQQFRSNQDPTYDLTIDEKNYTIFRVIFLIALCVYLMYLLYLIVRAFSELKNLPYLGNNFL